MNHRRLALLAVTIFAALAAPTGSASADETDLLYDSGDLSSSSLPDYDPATYTSGAYIAAEQPDYSPGHIVDIGGGGWAPGETVTLVFHPDPQVRADTTMTATADEDGYFMHSEYQLEDIDLGTTYTVTATGETSGQSATTTFTDAATDFYFAYASGNWNAGLVAGNNPVWRTCTNAAGTLGCTTANVTPPANNANVITIPNGFTVTVTAAVTADQVVVASGGQITVNSGVTMSLANGTGTDLDISGTVQDNGTIAEGSNVATVVQSGGALNVAGSFTGTGGSGSSRAVLTENAGATMAVTGTISGGLFNVALNGAGSVSGSGAISVNNNSDIAVGGNWSVATTAGMSLGGGTSSGFTVDGTLSLTGTATIHLTGGAAASNPMTIQNNGVLKMAPGTLITSSVGGPFNLAAGSFMEIGATDGIAVSGATGHIRTAGTRTFAQGANYTYNGTAAQVTGTGLPATVNEILKIDNSAGVTLSGARAMASSATLNLANGDLATGANLLTMNGNATCAGTGDVVSTVGGGVKRTAFTSGGATRCFGNPNNTIKIDSGSAPTDITMKLVKSVPTSPAFATAVARTYSITPNGGSSNATLSLHYTDGDLNGNTENALELWRVTSGAWANQGRTGSVDTVNGAVSLSGVTQFSDWTLASTATKDDQTITFDAPTGVTYGDADFDLGATASSNLPVSYTSNTTGVCTIVSGLLHIVTAGECSITASQAGNDDYNAAPDVERTFDIDPKELTVDGVTAEDKEYDGNTDATIDTTGASLNGVVGTDDVTLDTSGASGAFADAAVEEDKTVQIAGLTLNGADQGNYSLTQPTAVADIDPAELTVTGITAEDKDYDGNTDATIDTTGATLNGVVGTEDVTLDTSGASGAFDTADVGDDKTVQISGLALNGTDQGNYSLTQPTTTADIDPAELTVTGVTAEDKDYDGNTDATIDPSGATLNGVVGTEDVTLDTSGASGAFDTVDVGDDKTVQIAGLTLDGADKDNYSLTQPTTTADIDPAELTVTGITAEDKDYDGNTDATIDTTGATLHGVVGTEDVTLDTSGASGAFDTADVGDDKTVQISGLALNGTDQGNYSLTQPTTTADITEAELTVTGVTAEDKDYDGNTDATIDTSGATLNGVVGTEDVVLDTSGASGAFDTASPGVNKTVQISGLTLDGADKDNYSLTQPTAVADIDPAELTVTGVTAEDKDYDGNTDATIDTSGASLNGVVGTEDVTLDTSGASGAFDTADVGDDKTVQIAGLTLDGADKDNYSLTQPTAVADIDPAELTVTGITAEDKDYDGNTDATIDTSGASLNGVVGTEDVTLDTSGASGAFDTADVGDDKTVQISGLALLGADKDNYSLTQPTTTADIDPAELTVDGVTAEDKEYDGNTDATIDTSGASLNGVVGAEDVTLDTSGASGAFDTADVGDDKTVQISGLALDGVDKDNYTLTQPTATADIDPATLEVNADNKSKEFSQPNPTPTYTLSGFKNSEDEDSANVTGDADCSIDSGAGPDAGVYPNAITCEPGTLAAPNYTFVTGDKGTLTITAANTTITYSGDTSKQYSDKAHLKATLTSAGNPLEGMTVTFRLGSQDFVQDVTDANGVAELDLKVDQAPAVTFVVARFAGTNNYTQSSTGSQTFTVTQEDARATYTGFWDVATSSPSSSTATVTLSATIQDITDVLPGSDPEAGDIRKAKVDFINRDNNAVLCNDLPVGLVTPGNTKVGTVTCNWNANIGSADAVAYTIGIRVEGWYTRNDSAENAVVNVYKPLTTAFITGGGFLVNQSSAGSYYGDPGKRTNFGFNVKYNKAGTNLQGAINAIIRRGAYTYQVKGNAMTSLTSKLTSSPKTATFAGKANIQDITNPLQAQAIDGNATLQVTMSDYGTPGSSDKIGITVLNKSGGVWFASAWSGTKTLEQLLSGGNLTVR